MHHSKLINLVELISGREYSKLVEFVASPFFNKHEKTMLLLDHIVKYKNDLSDPALKKENTFEYIFPGEKYSEQRLKDVMSILTKLVEEFLAYQAYREEPLARELQLLKEFRKRRADKYFESTQKEVRKKLEKFPHRDRDYFQLSFLIELESDAYFAVKLKRDQNDSLQDKMDNLDKFYLSNKLSDLCEAINRGNIINAEYHLYLKEELLEHIAANFEQYQDIPAITVYYKILLTLEEPENEQHYEDLISLLSKHAQEFAKTEANGMYDFAKNYCIKKINSGKSEYLSKLFEVYKSLLENEIIYRGDYLSHWDYKNITTVATRLEAFEWAEDFLKTYKDKLPPEERDNAFAYNMAAYYFSRKEYHQAMDLLRDVEFTDLYYNIGAKTTLLKIYYQLNEFDALFSLIEAFRTYLKRNKLISKYQYQVNNNLLRFTKKLASLKSKKSFTSKEAFEKELGETIKKVTETKNITNINWLLQELDNLKIQAKPSIS